MNQASGRRFPWWVYWLALALILVLALWPLAGVAVSSWIAEAHGCMLNEATINPCIVMGADWGGALYMWFVLGWFMLATLPLGAAALLAWLAVLIVHRILWSRRKASPT